MAFYKKILFNITIIILIFITIPIFSENKININDTLYLNNNFYKKLSTTHSIYRDEILSKKINGFIQGKGKIIYIDKKNRYKRKFRVVLEDENALKYNLNIRYYIFFNNELSITMLALNQILEFKGQFMTVTEVNTYRDTFIFDVILENGAVIIK